MSVQSLACAEQAGSVLPGPPCLALPRLPSWPACNCLAAPALPSSIFQLACIASPSGFAYLMLQRYLDAAKCFNFILTYISK